VMNIDLDLKMFCTYMPSLSTKLSHREYESVDY
jgi:hypothetical protein